ncbi:hypothetical protein ACUZ9P_03680 [Desulfovibrio sp. QI0430]
MQKIVFFFAVIFMLSCPAHAKNGDDPWSQLMYNIIFDIGVQNRGEFMEIMKHLMNGEKMESSITGSPDQPDGFIDYCTSITFRDKDTNELVFNRIYAGSFKKDFTDITKTQAERTPYVDVMGMKKSAEETIRADKSFPPLQ